MKDEKPRATNVVRGLADWITERRASLEKMRAQMTAIRAKYPPKDEEGRTEVKVEDATFDSDLVMLRDVANEFLRLVDESREHESDGMRVLIDIEEDLAAADKKESDRISREVWEAKQARKAKADAESATEEA